MFGELMVKDLDGVLIVMVDSVEYFDLIECMIDKLVWLCLDFDVGYWCVGGWIKIGFKCLLLYILE